MEIIVEGRPVLLALNGLNFHLGLDPGSHSGESLKPEVSFPEVSMFVLFVPVSPLTKQI